VDRGVQHRVPWVAALGDLGHYWSGPFLAANAFIGLNLLGALLLGMLVGYERSYNGRAAGMRLYGLVCMASAALTVFVGLPAFWYGGGASDAIAPDPTRVVQGVVTGIGFLGAGVIMKDGLSISGLTTAASIWAASAIGILLGVGFYPAALLMALLTSAREQLVAESVAETAGKVVRHRSSATIAFMKPSVDYAPTDARRA